MEHRKIDGAMNTTDCSCFDTTFDVARTFPDDLYLLLVWVAAQVYLDSSPLLHPQLWCTPRVFASKIICKYKYINTAFLSAMHIKKIVIQGFKTYKNTTIIDLLSPNFNVVVGRNGSGKSNFFAAIRFVLSDTYTHMTREERQGLIHEGSGTVMSAYVEIVFDNTDRRFPLQKDEIAIRRTIGLKKDDYSLDGKSATRSDVMNLLESAGFSRLNPYYIVPQGRITALTNSKDAERLALLKEVSGAKVFESKLRESTKEMTTSNFKMLRIEEAMERLEEKLSDLQIELNDLQEYQLLEKNKKIFEFNLFDRELTTLNNQIEADEEAYERLLADSHNDIQVLEKREKVCQDLQSSIDDIQSKLKVSTLDREQANADYSRLLQLISEKEIQEKEWDSALESAKAFAKEQKSKVASFTKLTTLHEKEIAVLKTPLANLEKEELRLKKELNEATTKQRLLYAKQNRFLKFSSRKQRDEWLNGEVDSLSADLAKRREQRSGAESIVAESQEELIEFDNRIEDLRSILDNVNELQQLHKIEKEVNLTKARVTALSDQRKSLWREEIKLKSLHDSAEHDLSNATHKVNQTMDRAQSQGLKAVQQITERLNLQDSVYGPLADLFSISDKYKTAVEVVAGNSLFHVVVDTDETALTIMKELVRMKAGRITFMPLNRIHMAPVSFPESDEHEFIPLIKKIKHNHELVGKAIQQVFGRTIICQNLQRGSELARLYKLNAITLDGDRASNQGVLSGGFRDNKNSRFDALKLQAKKRKELIALAQQSQECTEKITEVNQNLVEANNNLDNKVRELEKQKSALEPQKAEFTQLLNKKFNLEHELNTSKQLAENLALNVLNLETKILQHREELESEFTHSLTEKDQKLLQSLTGIIAELEDKLNEVVTEEASVETKISKLEAERTNFAAYLNKYSATDALDDEQTRDFDLQNLQSELITLKSQLTTIELQREKGKALVDDLVRQLERKNADLQKADNQQIAIVKRLESVGKKTERILSKKAILDSRREDVQLKVRELGALPEEAFQQSNFETQSLDELLAELNTINNGLKKYSHINKKAMEQYNTFTREREELLSRQDELAQSKESIEGLMVSLEHQKDAAIKKSFEQVSKSFHEIFERLVPSGTGNLLMKSKDDEESDSIENYTGVTISVSFNSKHDEQQRIEQLSGGQKSLCAIALILAIQKCDPAPFYLFDEIDANLDTQYRTSVAAIINELAKNAQFICTTFRPEMIQVANTFYGVSFSNKVSTVLEIDRDEAISFVEGQR